MKKRCVAALALALAINSMPLGVAAARLVGNYNQTLLTG